MTESRICTGSRKLAVAAESGRLDDSIVKIATFMMSDILNAYRLAALSIRDLRRKGIRCHVEQRSDESGSFLLVVTDVPPETRRRS